jgi:hypothetical protein
MRPSLHTLVAGLAGAVAVATACGPSGTHHTVSTGGGTTTTTTTTTSVVTTGIGGTGGTGGLSSVGVGGDGGQPSTVYPAPHPAPPQVVSLGGPVLAAPHVVPVFFSNDDPASASQVIDFLGKVGSTQYWNAVVSEYGVGALTADAAVMLPETAPDTIDDSTIQAWLAGKLDSDDPAFPPADPNVIYAMLYPATTTITAGFGGGQVLTGCVNFGGYHDEITLDPAHGSAGVAYIVMPTCGDFDGLSGIDAITAAESHELVEACTDPYVNTMAAYAQPDDAHLYWLTANGNAGEVGDMCALNLSSFTKFPELDYVVQRTWSNAAAMAGQDPCVPPLPGEVYFNAAPEMSDTLSFQIEGQTANDVVGIQVPVGQAREVYLDLFSTAATPGPWSVSVQEMGSQNLLLEVGDDRGVNGQKVHLTITPQAAGQAVFIVSSSPTWTTSGQPNTWVGFVNN